MKPRIYTNEYKLTGQDLGNVLNLQNIEDILPSRMGRRKEGVFSSLDALEQDEYPR